MRKNNHEEFSMMIYLIGPPGAGKSTLGKKVCKELKLRFKDLSTPDINEMSLEAQKEIWAKVTENSSAFDVIALPFLLQQDKGIQKSLRKNGTLLLLWAHPLDMQERSGCLVSLFTPAPRIKTRGGFGRNGTGCREFRRLDKVADEVVLMIDMSIDDAADTLKEWLIEIKDEKRQPLMVRAGVADWVGDWQNGYGAGKKAVTTIVDAMARYLVYLRSQGRSSRMISRTYTDLYSAGTLVFSYEDTKGLKPAQLYELFSEPPCQFEFERKFADSDKELDKYIKSLQGFARFLSEIP